MKSFQTPPLDPPNTGKNEILAPERNFKWQKDKVRSLGLIFSSDPTNEATIKETNKLFYSLFWNGKNDKIKLDIMINNYPDGGLKMVDVESFNKALKVTWVKNAWTKTIGVSGIFFFVIIFILENLATVFLSMATLTK